jgi:hypothetical protein
MGFALSWLAVKGTTAEKVRESLGLSSTGEREEIPESPVVGAALPGGWYLVVFNEGFPEESTLKTLSGIGELVFAAVEEHVMYSTAAGYRDGERKWSVAHDAQKGITHLEADGELPDAFAAIRAAMLAEQEGAGGENADVDYLFDVPVNLAAELTGFRHDQDVPGAEGEPFEVLAPRSKFS